MIVILNCYITQRIKINNIRFAKTAETFIIHSMTWSYFNSDLIFKEGTHDAICLQNRLSNVRSKHYTIFYRKRLSNKFKRQIVASVRETRLSDYTGFVIFDNQVGNTCLKYERLRSVVSNVCEKPLQQIIVACTSNMSERCHRVCHVWRIRLQMLQYSVVHVCQKYDKL